MYTDGKAAGVRALGVRNGQGLELVVLPDRGMDIPYLFYRGINIGFPSKVGIVAPQFYKEDGSAGFLKQFHAGFLTGCGITYSGFPGEVDGVSLGLHGQLSNLPASDVNSWTCCEHGELTLHISGDIHQARVFGENVMLHREYVIETERSVVWLHDTVENLGFSKQPVMLGYHCNYGYPMLDVETEAYFCSKQVTPTDRFAAENIEKYSIMEAPEIGRDEQCFEHTDGPEDSFMMVWNRKLGVAAVTRYRMSQCPIVVEWKCMAAGEYVLGMEPTVSGMRGPVYNKEHQRTRYILPGESYRVDLCFEFTSDETYLSRLACKTKEFTAISTI